MHEEEPRRLAPLGAELALVADDGKNIVLLLEPNPARGAPREARLRVLEDRRNTVLPARPRYCLG